MENFSKIIDVPSLFTMELEDGGKKSKNHAQHEDLTTTKIDFFLK